MWLDLTPPDPIARREAILAGVLRGLDDLDQQRLVRETARLVQSHADPADAVRAAIVWSAERLEFGMTHAIGGAADWLRLFDRPFSTEDEKLAALGEILGHIADDARGGGAFRLPLGTARLERARSSSPRWSRRTKRRRSALLRGALHAGLTPDDLLPALAAAALAHYAGFGHSLIYVAKTVELTRRLGARGGGAAAVPAGAEPDLRPARGSAAGISRLCGAPGGLGTALASRVRRSTASALRGMAPKSAHGGRRRVGRAPSARGDLPCARRGRRMEPAARRRDGVHAQPMASSPTMSAGSTSPTR